jgi:hypothetical protein
MARYIRKTNRVYKKKVGKPTIYRQEFCQKAIDYFATGYDIFPTFEELGIILDVCHDRFAEWSKIYPEFTAAYIKCKALQRIALIKKGATGIIREGWAKFLGINCCGMAEKTEVAIDHSGAVDLSNGIQITWTNETIPRDKTQGG